MEKQQPMRVRVSPYTPKLLNMTFNGDPKTSRAFAWYTDVKTDTIVEVVEASQVQGDVFPVVGAHVYTGTSEDIVSFINAADRESINYTKFISHKVIATDLAPGTTYKFRAGNGEEGSWSHIGSFTTETADTQDYRFITGSDSQSASKSGFEPWADTLKKAIEHIGNPKFFINAGDFVDNGDLEEQWQWMLGAAEVQLLQVPIVPVLGGHEVREWSGDINTDNRNFYGHFNVPQQVVAGTHEGSVYSFEYGDALFMIFNTQFGGRLAENAIDIKYEDPEFRAQVNWMRHAVAKSDKKWKFVSLHKSPYAAGDNSAQWEDGLVRFYRKHLISVFDEMGIDLVFEAHDHMYMRSYQMYNDEVIRFEDVQFDRDGRAVDPVGTVYLMSNSYNNRFYNKFPGYDDYFAAINEQPRKKMFTEVSITDKVLSFTSYTAAVEDEGKEGTVGNGLFTYDRYAIRRTDVKPDQVDNVKVELSGNNIVISWWVPSNSPEPVKGFRIYEKNDKVTTHWSVYVPATEGQSRYSYTLENMYHSQHYNFIVKAVGRRMNSEPIEVTANKGAVKEG